MKNLSSHEAHLRRPLPTLTILAIACWGAVPSAFAQPSPNERRPAQVEISRLSPLAGKPIALPEPAQVKQALADAHARYKDLKEGKNASYIPALAQVDPKLFGIALVTARGEVYEIGDSKHLFAIESISKLFVLSRVMDEMGAEFIEQRIGVEPTGMPFNSVIPLEVTDKPIANPFVNAGAMATTSWVRGQTKDARWNAIATILNEFAGTSLKVDEVVYRSEAETNTHNKGLAELMRSYGKLDGDVMEAVDLYTKQCSVALSALDLAVMGATLANGGVNPRTQKQVVKPEHLPRILSVMQMNGLYNASGTWAFRVGLPAKSGVGGGLLAVVPGRFAIAAFSPPLDEYGNSVRGQRAIEDIARALKVNVFANQKP